MHILAILGALVGVLLFALFRMQQAANAARDIVDAADEARGVLRRWSWRRKHITNPLDTVDDAREAAAAMMVVVAQSDGGITERERTAITREMIKRFGATPDQAEALFARARWLVKDSADAGEVFRRLTAVIQRTCGATERSDLIEMLDAVARTDSPADDIVIQDIARFARVLKS
ncbi:MAG TPA: TerB family tellurite resistance protein [Hyphomicrobiaceae bacterium]|nr:TerB family tellurite resistance protein [Hyphomicrobiaceae bacterium]